MNFQFKFSPNVQNSSAAGVRNTIISGTFLIIDVVILAALTDKGAHALESRII